MPQCQASLLSARFRYYEIFTIQSITEISISLIHCVVCNMADDKGLEVVKIYIYTVLNFMGYLNRVGSATLAI